MTESADTAGTHAVGAIFGDTKALQRTLGTTFGDTVRANAICAIFGYTKALQSTLGAAFGDTVRANTICTIFSYAETLQRTLGTAFGDTIGTYAVSTVFGHNRSSGLLRGDLRQGKHAGRQRGDNEAGEDLLFHVRSPSETGE